MSQTRNTEPFHSHRILIGSFLIIFIMSGVGYFGFGIFFKPIQEEFNWGRGTTSLAFLGFYLCQAISSPFMGRLTDRYGPKKTIALGGLILSLSLSMLGLTSGLPHFYIAYGIMGLGCSATGMIPISYVISNWFSRNRGTAIGIVSSGMGAGGLILPIVIGTYLIPNFGWRTAYLILVPISFLIVIISQKVIKTNPHEIEYSENIKQSDEAKPSVQRSETWTFNLALKTPIFWLITASFILFALAHVGTMQHLVIHLTDIGFPLAVATTIFSAVNIVSSGGKLLFGYISDRIRAEYCAMAGFISALAATCILITLTPESPLFLVALYISLMGLAIGCWAPITSMLIGTKFGIRYYGNIYGAFSLFFYLGVGSSPTFYGYVYDTTHQYYLAYVSALVFYSVATIFILTLLRLKQTSPSAKLTRKVAERKLPPSGAELARLK
ncbi:MFS transporter [Candidatus Bathyarchaeota archaeon]|nr:MFS transporter [Candidatus Bathyarchaeota archaeon]